MPVMDFIRGEDKRRYMLYDVDNDCMIPNVVRADEVSGVYVVYAVDDHGKLKLSPSGDPVHLQCRGNIRVLRVSQDSDFRILR